VLNEHHRCEIQDVADGTQAGQFTIGDREPVASLADLDPICNRLLDEPVTAIVAVTGSDGQPNLTPVWFDYEGDIVLLNLATHRKEVNWLRKTPYATFLLMNPENTYHWISLKTKVAREVSEDDPVEGQRVTDQLDRIWVKYAGNEPPYGLRDPSFEERRVLFEMAVVKVATFGRPWPAGGSQPVSVMPPCHGHGRLARRADHGAGAPRHRL
jgi:nitroimidazol reductase NimA-like FMN-containing flavoprotein (pyridoxamine 5'-phosphate oxidase superfamily)